MRRAVLWNRYAATLGALALVTGGWNLYVARHAHGVVEGRVVGPDGAPVAGATVTLRERTLTHLEVRGTAETGPAGEFRFAGQPGHHVVLDAGRAGVGTAPRTAVRLWFRGQDLTLRTPLRLEPSR